MRLTEEPRPFICTIVVDEEIEPTVRTIKRAEYQGAGPSRCISRSSGFLTGGFE